MKRGFTLSEVLVTLGIIGVVSALTIPAMLRHHQKQVFIGHLRSAYSMLMEACSQSMHENNATYMGEVFKRGDVEGFLKNNFKIANDCGSNTRECFAEEYKNMDDRVIQTYNLIGGQYYSVSLPNGVSIALVRDYNNANEAIENISAAYGFIDTNGKEGPNVAGRDLFRISIFPDGVVDEAGATIACRSKNECDGASSPKELREKNFNQYCKRDTDAYGCFGKILNDGWQMNY